MILDCNASDSGLGIVLSQILDGEEKPISYASRTYNKQEVNYCITRRELLGLIFGLKHFKQYCLGRRLLVRTDHAPLLSMQTTPTPSSQMCRWLDFIAEYELVIQHRPGIRHGNADGLSRANPVCKQCKLSAESYDALDQAISTGDRVQVRAIHEQRSRVTSNSTVTTNSDVTANSQSVTSNLSDMVKAQLQDPDIKPVYDAMMNSTDAPDWTSLTHHSEDTLNLFAQWPLLTMQNNVLYRRWINGCTKNTKWLQCILPADAREEILKLAHTGMTGGHYGIRKTIAPVQRRSYWKTW